MKLKFTYGCMGSGKSAMLVMKEFNFRSRGYSTIVMKPITDTRDPGIIKPRPMEGLDVDILYKPEDDLFNSVTKHILYTENNLNKKFVIFVDEVQFSTKEQIEQLWRLSVYVCDVYVYGLKVNYMNEMFAPINALLVYAEAEEELEVGCKHCTNKATTHILYENDVLVLEGDGELIGDFEGEERFESICQKCRFEIINAYIS